MMLLDILWLLSIVITFIVIGHSAYFAVYGNKEIRDIVKRWRNGDER